MNVGAARISPRSDDPDVMDLDVDANDLRAVEEFEEAVINVQCPHLKGDWNVNPEEAIQAGASLFFDRATTAKPLYSLMSSLDLFSFWVLWLLATGYSVAVRRPLASAAVGVIGVWAIYVLGKVALSAFFQGRPCRPLRTPLALGGWLVCACAPGYDGPLPVRP